MSIIDLLAKNGWQFGFGDPYPVGYFICASYIAVSALCLYAGLSGNRITGADEKNGSILLWSGLALILLLLGINKQLDLQSLLIAIGRILAISQGWFDNRREVQALFAGIFTILSACIFLFIVWKLKTQFLENSYVLWGILLITSFIVMRALSINHIELNPFDTRMHLSTIHETAGIACIGYGAIRRIKLQHEFLVMHR